MMQPALIRHPDTPTRSGCTVVAARGADDVLVRVVIPANADPARGVDALLAAEHAARHQQRVRL